MTTVFGTRLGPGRPAEYEVDFLGDVRIPSSVPGATLGADLYLPRTDGPVPAVVTLHTGRRDGIGGTAAQRYLRYFAERGYAALYVDCFGIGTSDGTPRPLLSQGEVDDGVSLVEWAAAQPWCTGRVGMWGLSHGGMTTLAVAGRRPPHLRAIFPIMGWTDVGRQLVHPGGLRGGIALFGHLSLYHIFCALLPPLRRRDRADYLDQWRDRLDRFEPWFVDAWDHGPDHEVWSRRRIDPGRITVPALCVAGWRDLFCDAMIDVFDRIDAPKHLLAGPWLHSLPDTSGVEPAPSIAMGCAWWDRWLHGPEDGPDDGDDDDDDDGGGEAAATVYVQGSGGRWVRAEQWPPSGGHEEILVATDDGRLRPGTATGPAAPATVTGSGDVTVGALSGLVKHPADRFGHPLDQHDDDSRSLAFTGPPVRGPVVIAGSPTVTLVLAPGTTASRCVVKVTDVDEHDRSILISMGTIALSPAAGVQRTVPVRLDPTCYRVAEGHRIRLVLAESDVPRLWPPERIGRLSVRTLRAAETGGPGATALTLPVCDPRGLAAVEMVRPERSATRRPGAGVPTDRWELARDHRGGGMRMTLEKTDRVRLSGNPENTLSMATEIGFEVAGNDPLTACMVASGEKVAVTEDGDRTVVTGSIEMRTFDATVSVEVSTNGTPVFTKEWKLSAPERSPEQETR